MVLFKDIQFIFFFIGLLLLNSCSTAHRHKGFSKKKYFQIENKNPIEHQELFKNLRRVKTQHGVQFFALPLTRPMLLSEIHETAFKEKWSQDKIQSETKKLQNEKEKICFLIGLSSPNKEKIHFKYWTFQLNSKEQSTELLSSKKEAPIDVYNKTQYQQIPRRSYDDTRYSQWRHRDYYSNSYFYDRYDNRSFEPNNTIIPINYIYFKTKSIFCAENSQEAWPQSFEIQAQARFRRNLKALKLLWKIRD